MPLTPEDVHNKQFTTVRLREGYDEEEVDAFLDEVEAELTRLLRENEELRAKLAAASRAAAAAQQQPPMMDRPPMDRPPMERMPARREPVPIPPQLPAPMPVPVPQPAPPQFQPGGDSAARVLALAQQTADQAIAEARNEANKIVGEARTRADGMERDARGKADALERDAQEKHRVAMGTLEQARASLERKVEDLRAFEREYRQRLKSYLESQMRQLENNSSDDPMLSSSGAGRGGSPSPFPQLGPGSSGVPQQPAPAMAGAAAGLAPAPGPMQGMPGMSGTGVNPVMPAPAMAGSPMGGDMRGMGGDMRGMGGDMRGGMGGGAMSQMTQTMAPIRPGVPPQQPAPQYAQAPSPMRGFLIDEDPDS